MLGFRGETCLGDSAPGDTPLAGLAGVRFAANDVAQVTAITKQRRIFWCTCHMSVATAFLEDFKFPSRADHAAGIAMITGAQTARSQVSDRLSLVANRTGSRT